MTESNDELKYKTGWFACKVTPQYAMKLVTELSKLTEHPKWSSYIFDVFVPTEIVEDKKGNKKLKVLEESRDTIYIKMVLTQEVYAAIKLDGFRTPLPPKDPTPIPNHQMESVLKFRNKL